MSETMKMDLAASGLTVEDIHAREAGPAELAACSLNGRAHDAYVIPYFDIHGLALPFYRVKNPDSKPKYKQPKNTANHLYFPPGFLECLNKSVKDGRRWVILTEGEKKAAYCCKLGIPCVAIGGVDSWRNRTLLLPKETKLSGSYGQQGLLQAKLPSIDDTIPEISVMATGLADLIVACNTNDLTFIIIFDADDMAGIGSGLKQDVQRAAAQLGYELRFQGLGVSQIRQAILPLGHGVKMGLDDFMLRDGAPALIELLEHTMAARNAFPRHPNPRLYINSKLQGKVSRREAQSIALAVLCELDASGRRLRSSSGSVPYYFDEDTYRLMPAALMHKHGQPLHESVFGAYLYTKFALNAGDTRLLTWLASQYTAEEPIEEVEPQSVCCLHPNKPDHICYQLSDSHFAIIGPNKKEPIIIVTNGTDGILFEQDRVEPVNIDALLKLFNQQLHQQLEPWWLNILGSIAMVKGDKARKHAALLYYLSPFLNRWRGSQLPIELMIGEPGSGKSSVYNLRLTVLTGRPSLRNVPNDIRDWHASVTDAGGLHVIDNVQFTNKDLKQRLSDEMCRIVTEPDPHVEMRQLYTTSSQARYPIKVTFALTAISTPFQNADLIQRSAIFNLEAIKSSIDSDWVGHQLEKIGGREKFLAHHLVFLHKFLSAVVYGGFWETEYQASHRLAHYEQNLRIAGELFNMKVDWLPEMLFDSMSSNMAAADWTLQGLQAFAELVHDGKQLNKFTAGDIATWMQDEDDFRDNPQLISSRSLGRYMVDHKQTVVNVAGIVTAGMQGNRRTYKAQKKGD